MRHLLRSWSTVGLLAAVVTVGGCSYARMHGYSVVRTDTEVRYRPGEFELEVSSSDDGASAAALDAGIRRGLEARAPEFVPAARGRFRVRVAAEPSTLDEGRMLVAARIEITDPTNGVVSSELVTEHTLEEAGSMDDAGHVIGQRLGHYLRERERYYHW